MIVTKEISSFYDLRDNSWGQAKRILDEIADADKEDELMDFLEDYFTNPVDETDLNDIISFDWEWLYEEIGMNEEEEDEYEDEVDECGFNPYDGCYDYDC